jgi:oligopeptide/dipeptide ABC transporter ATP-binding protein
MMSRSRLVDVRSLSVSYAGGSMLLGARREVVSKVSFEIDSGQCFALVGESGSGKSTIVRAMLGLERIESGRVAIGDHRLPFERGADRLAFRRSVQAVFQDPLLSLNPRHSVATIVGEPLAIHGFTSARRRARVLDVLGRVQLPADILSRRPAQLSGGQRQRVCIARALALEPCLLIADEPLSSLDVRVQAGIMDLLMDLKERERMTLLLVSHDMDLVRLAADRVGVLYSGRLVEIGPVGEVYDSPAHPYTRSLLAASPERLKGALPGSEMVARRPPSAIGCAYRDNCRLADLRCQSTSPPMVYVSGEHRASCFKCGAGPGTGA